MKAITVAIILMIAMSTSLLPSYANTQDSNLPWLHTSGQDVYGGKSKVQLYAAAIHYGGNQHITLSDIQKIRSMGFNTIRLHLYWGLLQPNGPSTDGIDTSYFNSNKNPLGASIDDIVYWCQTNGMYIVLNIAWTNTYQPPSWAFPDIKNDNLRFETLIKGTGQEQTALDALFGWLANHYKNNSNVIFEGINEPTVYDTSLAATDYRNFNEAWINAIEKSDGNQPHVKIIQFLLDRNYNAILTNVSDVNNSNILWASHNYEPMNSWNPGGSLGISYVTQRIQAEANMAHNWNRPWINTEWSKVTSQNQWQEWYTTVLGAFTDNNITGWTYWCYCSDPNAEPGWNINNPTTAANVMPFLNPYLAQVAPLSNPVPTTPQNLSSPIALSTPSVSPYFRNDSENINQTGTPLPTVLTSNSSSQVSPSSGEPYTPEIASGLQIIIIVFVVITLGIVLTRRSIKGKLRSKIAKKALPRTTSNFFKNT